MKNIKDSVIGTVDGPTSVFIIKKNQKLTWKQRLQKTRAKIKRAYIEKTLKAGSHTLEEVMEYVINVHGLAELGKKKTENEYQELRASFLMQYNPELLGEYATMPQLKSESKEDIQAHIKQFQERQERAKKISTEEFDIDFHKFERSFDDINDNIHIIIEKKFAYIGGGASGNKKIIKRFNRIYKDIYRYYGVSEEDIKMKSKRYENIVRALMH